MTAGPVALADITPDREAAFGGKAAGLARLTRAGLPVPPGFALPADVYRHLHAAGCRSDPALAAAITAAFHALGGPVAVRSSAADEDGAAASFAGQGDTTLGAADADAVLDAVGRCWKSLASDRADAYRKRQGAGDAGRAMGVVVQKLVPADVAGVLFTRDPHDPAGVRMSVEAAWGLGEVVVSGRVTPDRFAVDFATGAVLERRPGDKRVEVTPAGEREVDPDRRHALCLDDATLARLADLGRRVEALAGEPRDVEWALAGGELFLLQARPVTAASAADRERVRAEVVADLERLAGGVPTAWVRYNLSEVLPAPTPMTWAVVQRLIRSDGGFGALNRDLGAYPDPTLNGDAAFDLVAGRPMANLLRLPRMQSANPAFEYPLAKYKHDPRLALDPKPVLNPARGGVRAWLRLPLTAWRLYRMSAVPRRLGPTFAAEFTTKILPAFTAAARAELAADWSGSSDDDLRTKFRDWTERTLVTFARDSLKPTVLADLSWQTLAAILTPKLGAARAQAAVAELALGAKPPPGADLAAAVGRLTRGELSRAGFLDRFGHRGPDEMELSSPRWSDDPARLPAHPAAAPDFADLSARLDNLTAATPAPPDAEPEAVARVAAEAKLSGPYRALVATWTGRLRTYLGLREAGKNGLLLGYGVVRKALVMLAVRHDLGDGVFYLSPSELDALGTTDFAAVIRDRKARRRVELSLEVPPVLFADDLAAVGRPLPPPAGATLFEGTPLSAGTAEAPALVRRDPSGAVPPGPYVLVCPSTDPAWVPLFANAAALVLETGGVLSHGAIVAREFGLPAVAGPPDATRLIPPGALVRVDGGRGTVAVAAG